jgi:hypothetical protein
MSDINYSRFTGFADLYDDVRPRPPKEIPELVAGTVKRKMWVSYRVRIGIKRDS